MDVKMIPGLCTEIPRYMTLTAYTIATLLGVEKKGVARFEGDDGPLSITTIEQLDIISGNVGYECIKVTDHICLVVDIDHVPYVTI